MQFKFSVYGPDDALIAKDMLDAYMTAYNRVYPEDTDDTKESAESSQFDKDYPVSERATAASVDTGVLAGTPITGTTAVLSSDTPFSFTKEQIKTAAAINTELANLVSKKGRKSAEQIAEINRLTAAAFPEHRPESPVGAAFQGQTAEQLNEALKSLPVVHTAGDVEVRSLTYTDPQVVVAAAESVLNEPQAQEMQQTSAPVISPLSAIDPDLAALAAARQAQTQQTAPQVVEQKTAPARSRDELLAEVQNMANNGRGFQWFFKVVVEGGGDVDKLTVEYLTKVLANPDAHGN